MDERQTKIVAAFSAVADKDREYANDLIGDLLEYDPRATWNCIEAEEIKIIAEWFRKARCEAVLEWTAKPD